jgi:hypothetical protein
MADNQGTYRIQIVVDGDDNINARINGLTKGYTTLAKAVAAANAKLNDQNKAHKGTANFYKEQIGYLEDLRDRLAKTTGETTKYNAAIEKLQKRNAALSAPMKGTLAAYRLEVQELRKLQAELAKTPEAYDRYEAKIASVKTNVEKLTKSQSMQIKTNKDMISNAGLGGATLTELGRTVSDSNYGFTAMANNLSQLSTLFITFVSKTEGGLMPALRNLGGQLMGPLGIVLALQVVIAAFEKFSMSQKEAERDIKRTTDALSGAQGQIAQLEKHATVLNDSTTNVKAQEYALKQLKKEGYDPLIGSLEQFLEMKKAILLFDVREEQMRGKIKEALDKQLELQGELKEAEEDRQETIKNILSNKNLTDQIRNLDIGIATEKFKKESGKITGELDVVKREIDGLLNISAKAIETLGLKFGDNPFFGPLTGDEAGAGARNELSNILRDLQDEYDIFMAERFDKERLASANELRDTKEELAELVREKKLSQSDENAAIEIAQNLHSERMKAIDKSEYDYYVDLIQKQANEYGKLLDDFKKARDNESKEAIQAVIDDGLKVSNERKKEAVNSIKDKKKLQAEFREIDKDILESQIELIKIAISVGNIGAEQGLKIIEKFQAKLVALGLKGADSETAEMTKEEIIKNSIDTFEALGNALANAIQLEIDAELSREERKTAIQNNALKERLRNENLSANQRAAINKRIENNEIALQKKRDELAEKSFKLQKAVAIGQTLISTYEMATKAFKALAGIPVVGPALGKAAAIAATAFGLAQVNAIRKQQFVPSGMPAGSGGGSGGGATISAPEFNIVGQSASNQVAQAVQGQFDKPVKAYVVSKDITTAQEMDRNIVSTASI